MKPDPKTGMSFPKDKIVQNALLAPMVAIDEVINEDTDRDNIEVKAQGPTEIVKINIEQIELEEFEKVRN
jgi:hypothetical protein